MRKTQILTNLKETNCCEVTPTEKLIYFPTNPCKLRKIRTSLKTLGNRGQLGRMYASSLYPLYFIEADNHQIESLPFSQTRSHVLHARYKCGN